MALIFGIPYAILLNIRSPKFCFIYLSFFVVFSFVLFVCLFYFSLFFCLFIFWPQVIYHLIIK